MPSSDEVRRQTAAEWRELGFFYDRDDACKEWRLVGSGPGLRRFVSILRAYVADPQNTRKSEHEHHGPYGYLKIMTWPDAGMDESCIRGSLSNLAHLADLVEAELPEGTGSRKARIREEYTADAEYALVLDIRESGFDPASGDPGLVEGAG
jgi:hypothetical protein